MSQSHATTIAAGNELEKMVWERVPHKIDNLTEFVESQQSVRERNKVFVANKKQVKACELFDSELEPDLIAFKHLTCYIIEVKDGDTLDTKKAQGEQDTMTRFSHEVANNAPYMFKTIMCCFNADSREQIHTGLKRRFALDQCMTGAELCQLIGIDYDEIVRIRRNDCQSNLDYFVRGLIDIPNIRNMIRTRLKK